MSKVIGFCGTKGVGKDTAADALLEEGWARVRFSQALKEITAEAFGIKPLFLEDPAFKDMEFEEKLVLDKKDVDNLLDRLPLEINELQQQCITTDMIGRVFTTPRELLQYVGTDVVRNQVDVNGWVEIARRKIQDWFSRGVNVVVTDVRFPNEADVVTKLGGKLVKINRDTLSDDNHESETQELDHSITLQNNDDIYSLHKQVRSLI